jgi:hypothetical protein
MCISAYNLMPYLPCHYLYISFILLHLLSTNHKCTQPCYSNLLLRRRRWTRILRWGVLGYVLPQLPFLWCYGVFHCSVYLRVVLVFKDIIYVIIILYIHDIWLSVTTVGRMCGTIVPESCIWWVHGFGIKFGYDRRFSKDQATKLLTPCGPDGCQCLSPDRREETSNWVVQQ